VFMTWTPFKANEAILARFTTLCRTYA
jgi:hypothetical protein